MSLSELSVRRPVFATMLVMSLVVMGIFSFRDLGVDLFPQADPATVTVSVQLPGASPAEMATAVVEPLEEALSSISGIDEMLAQRISEGSATVTLRFVLERDINDAANDVREKVSGAMRNLPPQVLPPVIQKVDPDSDPIMSIVLSSDTMSLRTLTEIADKQVKRAIETVNGVGQVDLGGGRAREIHVVVDIEKLNGYGLTIEHVRDAIAAENVEVPGGTRRAGQVRNPPAHARTHRRRRGVQPHHRRDGERHADPHLGHRLRRGHHRAPAAGGVAGRLAGGDARRPARHRREHHRRHRGRQGEARPGPPDAAQGSHADGHARRLEVHLRRDRLARGAPALGQLPRRPGRDVLHPQPAGRHHRLRWPFPRRSSPPSR